MADAPNECLACSVLPQVWDNHGTHGATHPAKAETEAAWVQFRHAWPITQSHRQLAQVVQDGGMAGDPVECTGRGELHLRSLQARP